MMRELRRAVRRWAHAPGHSVVVVLTMALGIGATTVLFSVLHGVLLRPLPWAEGERLVRLAERREGASRDWPLILTNATYLAWRERPTTVEEIAAWQRDTVTLSGAGEAERTRIATVTASLFPLLRVAPALGAVFTEADEAAGDVVVLSHGLWQSRFGGRGEVLGRAIELDGRSHRVIGVMPAGFAFPDRTTRAWVPFRVPPVVGEDGESRSVSIFGALARLAPGATAEQAAQEGTIRARAAPDLGMAARAMFGTDGVPSVTAIPAREALTAEVRPALLLLLAAVGLLLATATANVASLQLAAVTRRRRELALRLALGAEKSTLRRMLLLESGLIGLAGGLVGLLLAALGHRLLPALLPADFPRVEAIVLDLPVMLFAVALSLVTGLLFGAAPASFLDRASLTAAIGSGGSGTVGGGAGDRASSRVRRAILVGQVAVASFLLIGGLQIGRSFFAMLDADRGFEPGGLLTARVPLPVGLYTPERRAELIERASARLAALPGVTAVGTSGVVPLSPGDAMMTFTLPGRGDADEVAVHTGIRVVSPGYFQALGRRVVQGRALADGDLPGSEPVLAVNETFAERYLPGGKAVGARLPVALGDGPREWTVVGVVEDVVQQRLGESEQPELFVSYGQLGNGNGIRHSQPILLVRTEGDPAALVPTVRAVFREQDASLALDDVETMEQALIASLSQPRLYTALFGVFALCASTLAGVGLFGLLSFLVASRTREIGLRVALGAGRSRLVGWIVGHGLRPVTVGLGLGVVAAMIAGRLGQAYLDRFLYRVSPFDPLAFLAVALLLVAVAVLAAGLPARRASAIAPQEALRAD